MSNPSDGSSHIEKGEEVSGLGAPVTMIWCAVLFMECCPLSNWHIRLWKYQLGPRRATEARGLVFQTCIRDLGVQVPQKVSAVSALKCLRPPKAPTGSLPSLLDHHIHSPVRAGYRHAVEDASDIKLQHTWSLGLTLPCGRISFSYLLAVTFSDASVRCSPQEPFGTDWKSPGVWQVVIMQSWVIPV